MYETKYPELAKQHAVIESGASDTLTEFFDWLGKQGYFIAEYLAESGRWEDRVVPITKRTEQLFADFFGINLDKIESERRAILEELRDA